MRAMKITLDDHVAGLQEMDSCSETDVNASQVPVVAFFDLDRTLIDGYSLTALAWQQIFNLQMSPSRFIKLSIMFSKYGLGRISYAEMLEATIADIRGMPESDLIELARQAFEKRMKAWIYQEGIDLVESHRHRGHLIVLVTSATRYQAEPVTEVFEFDAVRCTELEIADGKVAGGVTPCYGAGKLVAARSYCEQTGTDLKDAYFYTDSADDMPLLEQVGNPVVVNGKDALLKLAERRKWPSIDFTRKGFETSP